MSATVKVAVVVVEMGFRLKSIGIGFRWNEQRHQLIERGFPHFLIVGFSSFFFPSNLFI